MVKKVKKKLWLTETQYEIFQIVQELKAVTLHDIVERLPERSATVIGLCLLDMVYRGVLIRYKERRYFRKKCVFVYEINKNTM